MNSWPFPTFVSDNLETLFCHHSFSPSSFVTTVNAYHSVSLRGCTGERQKKRQSSGLLNTWTQTVQCKTHSRGRSWVVKGWGRSWSGGKGRLLKSLVAIVVLFYFIFFSVLLSGKQWFCTLRSIKHDFQFHRSLLFSWDMHHFDRVRTL